MDRTDQVMKYIVGLSAAAAVSLSGWNLLSTVGHEARIGVVEERSDGVRDRLNRIEDKVDWLIQQRIELSPEPARVRPRPAPRAERARGEAP